MNKKLLVGILIFLVVLLVAFFLRSQETGVSQNQEIILESPISNSQSSNTTSNSNTNFNTVSIQELEKHNSVSDCWIVYKNKVYDITSYLPRHPGSSGAISPYCGSETEFEKAFTKKHGTSKVSLLMKVGTFIGDFDIVGNLN